MNIRTMRQVVEYLFVLTAVVVATSAHAVVGRDYPLACLEQFRAPGQPGTGPFTAAGQSVELQTLNPSASADGFELSTRSVQVSVQRFACDPRQSVVLVSLRDLSGNRFPQTMMFPRLRAVQDGRSAELRAVALQDGVGVGEGGIGNIHFLSLFAIEVRQGDVDLSQAFRLTVTPVSTDGSTAIGFDIAAYRPTPKAQPEAFGARLLNGRYAGNYFDPEKSGEGIIVEIGDVPNQPGQHFLQFSWFTYDNDGNPFWISGGNNFADGDRHLHMPAAFRGGGRFAGARRADVLTSWGSVDIEFSDCDTVQIDYSSSGKFPANVPTGSGRRQWRRLTGVSDYSCN